MRPGSVAGQFLHVGPERARGLKRSFCKSVKGNSAFPWRLQGAGDARIVGYLPKESY